MIKKHIYDLTGDDLNQFHVWYFPMDDTVEDETVVVPVVNCDAIKQDYQIIVKTKFVDNNNYEYNGYIFWGTPSEIDFIKPTLLLDDLCITFWNGMGEPENDYIKEIKKKLKNDTFPFSFESIETMGLEQIKGNLKGIYYIDNNNDIKHTEI